MITQVENFIGCMNRSDKKYLKNYNYVLGTVDKILGDEDKNDDGYLSYTEYASSRRTTRMLSHAAKNMSW